MIFFEEEVLDYLDGLLYKLNKQKYFSYEENVEAYVLKLLNFIYESIKTFPAKNTPNKLILYGSKYIFYKANARTTWYIFFESQNDDFLITHIINNHCEDVNWL